MAMTRKSAAKTSAAGKASAKKSGAGKVVARKAVAKKAAAKKSPAKKVAAGKSTAKKSAAVKKSAVKKPAARQTRGQQEHREEGGDQASGAEKDHHSQGRTEESVGQVAVWRGRRRGVWSSGNWLDRQQRCLPSAAWTFGSGSVRVAIAWRGVLAVDVPDGPRAGSVLELRGESEFEFTDGIISRIVDRS
ncbi:hypothetical protein LSPH26S_03821 [Lysinibacillus sphaericus]